MAGTKAPPSSQGFDQASRELQVEGFNPIYNLNQDLIEDLLYFTKGKHVLSGAKPVEQFSHAMVVPVAILLAYFAYWPFHNGDMVMEHFETVGIAVLRDTHSVLHLPNLKGVPRKYGRCSKYNWADLVDFIFKLVNAIKPHHSPQESSSAKMLYQLCMDIRHHKSAGTSPQETFFGISYKFRTKDWVNAFASTRKALHDALDNVKGHPLADLHKAILKPLNPQDPSVWNLDVNFMERNNIDAAVDFLVVHWPREVEETLHIANATMKRMTQRRSGSRGGSMQTSTQDDAGLSLKSPHRRAKADWVRPNPRPEVALEQVISKKCTDPTTSELLAQECLQPYTAATSSLNAKTDVDSRGSATTETHQPEADTRKVPLQTGLRRTPRRNPATPNAKRTPSKQQPASAPRSTGPKHSPPQANGATESPTKKPRVYTSPTAHKAAKGKDVQGKYGEKDGETEEGCQEHSQEEQHKQSDIDLEKADAEDQTKKEATGLIHMAVRTHNMAVDLVQMATKLVKKAAELEEQAREMLQLAQTKDSLELSEK